MGILRYRSARLFGFYYFKRKENKEVRNLIGGLKTYKAAVAQVQLPPENEQTMSEDSTPGLAFEPKNVLTVDACGIRCSGPVLKLKKTMEELADETSGNRATDIGFPRDAEAWCRTSR